MSERDIWGHLQTTIAHKIELLFLKKSDGKYYLRTSLVTGQILENVASIFFLPRHCFAFAWPWSEVLPLFSLSLSLSLANFQLYLSGWTHCFQFMMLFTMDHSYHSWASTEEPDGWHTWAATTTEIKTIKCEEMIFFLWLCFSSDSTSLNNWGL